MFNQKLFFFLCKNTLFSSFSSTIFFQMVNQGVFVYLINGWIIIFSGSSREFPWCNICRVAPLLSLRRNLACWGDVTNHNETLLIRACKKLEWVRKTCFFGVPKSKKTTKLTVPKSSAHSAVCQSIRHQILNYSSFEAKITEKIFELM